MPTYMSNYCKFYENIPQNEVILVKINPTQQKYDFWYQKFYLRDTTYVEYKTNHIFATQTTFKTIYTSKYGRFYENSSN